MSQADPPDGDRRDRTEFDWESPRWRDAGEDQGDAERENRFRYHGSRSQHGAIDRKGSIPGGSDGGRGSQPEDPSAEATPD